MKNERGDGRGVHPEKKEEGRIVSKMQEIK